MSSETKQSWPATTPGKPGYRRAGAEPTLDGETPNGTAFDLTEKPKLPSLDPAAPPEPQFPADSWLDPPTTSPLADHPLLRGLLLELPPKGTTPPADWLDRWFEATRSILELLYVR
ncbi:MAG TPA: hypothetical protein VIL37_19220 [Natronosporangium sp.]